MDDADRRRFAAIGSAFLGKVAQRLQTVKPEELSPADLSRWTDVAAKLVQAGATHEPYDREARLASQRIVVDGELDDSARAMLDTKDTRRFTARELHVFRPEMRPDGSDHPRRG